MPEPCTTASPKACVNIYSPKVQFECLYGAEKPEPEGGLSPTYILALKSSGSYELGCAASHGERHNPTTCSPKLASYSKVIERHPGGYSVCVSVPCMLVSAPWPLFATQNGIRPDMYMYIYIYKHTCLHIYIYIYAYAGPRNGHFEQNPEAGEHRILIGHLQDLISLSTPM